MPYPPLVAVKAGVCAVVAAMAVAALAAQPAVSAATPKPTAADVSAALVTRDEARAVLDDSLWAQLPQVTTAAMYSRKAPGLRLFVVRNFYVVDPDWGAPEDQDRVTSTLTVYASAAAAAADYRAMASSTDAPSTPVAGPAVGEESRWFARTDPGDKRFSELTARFRAGSLVGRVSIYVRVVDRASDMDTVARLVVPVAARAARVSAGDLRAQPLPAVASQLPRSVPRSLRPIVALVEPPTAWAIIDVTGNPTAVESQLRRGGVKHLAFAAYDVKADPRLSVEVVLFPFASATAAHRWVVESFPASLEGDKTAHRLDTGSIGSPVLFYSLEWGYEMQFAAGRFAADVTCLSYFYEASDACIAPMLDLAKRWSVQLGR